MAATENRTNVYKQSSFLGRFTRSFKVGTAVHFFRGTGAKIDADGYAKLASNDATAKNGGVVTAEVDNSNGADGDKEVVLDIAGAKLIVGHDTGSLTDANVGDDVYWTSDNTVDSSGNLRAGVITEVIDADNCEIEVEAYSEAA